VAERPRILVLDGSGSALADLWKKCQPDCELVQVDSPLRVLASLRQERFDAVLADARDHALWGRANSLLQAEKILEALHDGVAVVTADLHVVWANPAFERWCGGPAAGRGFFDALGSPEVLGPDYSPFHTALDGKPAATRLHLRDKRFLDLQITPVLDAHHKVTQLIVLCRDVTAEAQQRHKLDALHQAGNEIAGLNASQLAEMIVEERVELLKRNIRRLMHDLLHYDVLEVRLLDRQTGQLIPLLQEGMTPEATGRALFARAEGNGITGFVACTGKSYLCPDTASDPLYLEGSSGARSSLTVPLVVHDEVIGTFNVESPRPNAFGQDDLQFAEIFSREIAAALHTLELLTAQKRSAASQSVEAVNREVALPVANILAAATAVLDRYIGHDPEMGEKLRLIIANARAVKSCIQKVGEDLAPPLRPEGGAPPPAHARLKGMRILVADSDERVRRSAHSLLGRYGCVVETARDGQEALTMARLSPYDAVLTDIRLPDLSGYDSYCRFRQLQPTAQVILMTAYGYDPSHSIVKARQEGLKHVLFKPFRVDQLLDALANPAPPPAKCGA
jgi:two-component system, sensor histidine kinase SagS